MDYLTFARVDKVLLAEILIEKGMFERAFTVVTQYGYEGIRMESLVKLASRMILRTEFMENEELVYLSFYVFEAGKYDDIILSYLSDNLIGPVGEMALFVGADARVPVGYLCVGGRNSSSGNVRQSTPCAGT